MDEAQAEAEAGEVRLRGLRSLEILFEELQLEELDISETSLIALNPEDFCKLLRYNKTLTSLSLAGCMLSEYVMLQVLQVVNAENSQLSAINFSENDVTLEVAKAIKETLQNRKLVKLGIANCKITVDAMKEILNGVSQAVFLKEINLSDFNFADQELNKALLDGLLKEKNIEKLSLDNCEISDQNFVQLLKLPLKTLDLSDNKLNFGEEVFASLTRNTHLEVLNIRFLHLDDEDSIRACRAVLVCNKVREKLGVAPLDVVGLRIPIITDEDLARVDGAAEEIVVEIKRKKAAPEFAPFEAHQAAAVGLQSSNQQLG